MRIGKITKVTEEDTPIRIEVVWKPSRRLGFPVPEEEKERELVPVGAKRKEKKLQLPKYLSIEDVPPDRLKCPRCGIILEAVDTEAGLVWRCPKHGDFIFDEFGNLVPTKRLKEE